MDFRTKVELPVGKVRISHHDRLLMLGSCFTDNIGRKLQEAKLPCEVNPYGALYNPLSVAAALKELNEEKTYTVSDLIERDGLWHSWMHHGDFSGTDPSACLQKINHKMASAGTFMQQATWILITWGTAWVYEKSDDGRLVGNCHKFPEKMFTRRLLEVDEIITVYQQLIRSIRSKSAQMQFLFTISPIRHAKDTMHGNQVSKSVLQLAVHKLCQQEPACYYFPSYEIMMDELRDYRFYAEDMIHPSSLAVEYIWQCFSETYFSSATTDVIEECRKIRKALEHRPFHPESAGYHRFLSQILLKIQLLQEKFPYLDVQNEISLCQAILKKSLPLSEPNE